MSENPLPIPEDGIPTKYRTVVFDKSVTTWETIKPTVLALHRSSFPEIEDLEEKLQRGFTNKDTIAVLLYDLNNVIGYTFALPWTYLDRITRPPRQIKTAAIDTVVLAEQYRGKKLIAPLMTTLEEELRKQGYEQFIINAFNPAYATAIDRFYGTRGRILEKGSSVNFRGDHIHQYRLRT